MIRQIQKRPLGSSATPLFMFHDASGTISSYYALGSMGRDVYAIADSLIDRDHEKSMQEMSRRYYAHIKKLVPGGRIIIGGWSLGGMIALQVASIFARDHNVQVGGIVMIDVPFPDYGHMALLNPDSSILEYGPTAAPNKFERFIFRSVNMLHKWRVSVWRRQRQPYTVKLCASERVSSEGHHHPALFAVDQFRDSLTLGWNERAGPAVVDKSYSIKSHHFGIFEPKNVASVTNVVAAIAADIESVTCQDDDD